MSDNYTSYQQPMINTGMPQQNALGPTQCTSKYPEQFFCVNCKRNLVSRVESSWGIGAWVWCLFCSPSVVLAFLPCCVDGLRDIKHVCPSCENTVGKSPCLC